MLAPVVLDDLLRKDTSSHGRKNFSSSSSRRHASAASALIKPITNRVPRASSPPASHNSRRNSVASRRGRRQTLSEFDAHSLSHPASPSSKKPTAQASTLTSRSINAQRPSASETCRATLPETSSSPRSRLASLVADNSMKAARRRTKQPRASSEKQKSAKKNNSLEPLMLADTSEYEDDEDPFSVDKGGLSPQAKAALQQLVKSGVKDLDLSFSSSADILQPPPALESHLQQDISSEQNIDDVVKLQHNLPASSLNKHSLTGQDKSSRRGTAASQRFFSSASPKHSALPKNGGSPPINASPIVDLTEAVHESKRAKKDVNKKRRPLHTVAELLGDLDEPQLKEPGGQKKKTGLPALTNKNTRVHTPPTSEVGLPDTDKKILSELAKVNDGAPIVQRMSMFGSLYANGTFPSELTTESLGAPMQPMSEVGSLYTKEKNLSELTNVNNSTPTSPTSRCGSQCANGTFSSELTSVSDGAPVSPMSEVGSPYTNGDFVLQAGTRVQVLSRDKLSGSARVRDAAGREATLPDVAFRCDGEVARGLVSQYPDGFTPDRSGPRGQLRLPRGSLVRIVGEEGDYYKVCVDGMRGFVAQSAVEVATHNLCEALQMQRLEHKIPAIGASATRGSFEHFSIKEDTFAIIRNFRLSDTTLNENNNAGKFKSWKQYFAPVLQPQRRCVPCVLGAWAYSATFWTAFCQFMLSIAGLYFGQRESFQMPRALYLQYHSTAQNGIMIYSLLSSVGIALTHALPVTTRWNLWTLSSGFSESRFLRRTAMKAVFFSFGSLPLLFSYFTVIPASMNILIGFLYLVSFCRREVGNITSTARAASGYSMTTHEHVTSAWAQIPTRVAFVRSHAAMSGHVSIIALWLALNASLFICSYFSTVRSVQRLDKAITGCWIQTHVSFVGECSKLFDVYETYFAVARGFSVCINANSALLLLVASPSVVREFNRVMGASPRVVSSIWGFAPLSNSAACQKFLGGAIFLFGILHSWAHYMAQTFTLPVFPFNVFLFGEVNVRKGIWVTHFLWATGAIVLVVLTFLMSAAQRFIRDKSYRLFFYTHVIGTVLYFALMLFHSKDFWWYTFVPLIIYSIDRYHWSYSNSTALIKLVELNFNDPVLNLVFSVPWRYETAQRVFFSCPLLSPTDWHSVVISSPNESDVVSLHFITRPGSWTERLRELCAELVQECAKEGKGIRLQGENGFSFKFGSTDWMTGRKTVGISIWNNCPLFALDGPHSSPAMHFTRFETVMLVCTSATLPMLHSILASLVLHRWRKESTQTPIQLYVVWLCPQCEVFAHRWFMEALSEFEVVMSTLWKSNLSEPQRHFFCEMHFFVTSTTEQRPPVSVPPLRKIVRHRGEEQVELQQPYVANDLLDAMQSAHTPAATFSNVMSQNQALRVNAMGHVTIWNGRPPWADVFRRVRLRHSSPDLRAHRVGVIVGASMNVAQDVYSTARRLSDSTIVFQVVRDTFK